MLEGSAGQVIHGMDSHQLSFPEGVGVEADHQALTHLRLATWLQWVILMHPGPYFQLLEGVGGVYHLLNILHFHILELR